MGLRRSIHLIVLGAAYNLPELTGYNLALSPQVIADIYLNRITKWNDQRIKSINTQAVADLLPDQPITVILDNVTAVQSLWTYWLQATVPEWTVRITTLQRHLITT